MSEARPRRAISIIGLGYVGLTTAIGFHLKGHRVVGIEIDPRKVEAINEGVSPIQEKGVEELLRSGNGIRATLDYREVLETEVSFICVETPSGPDGSISLHRVREATQRLADALQRKDGYHLVVIKSTVVPGTTEEVVIPILQSGSRVVGRDTGVCVCPEFLRRGDALRQVLHPDRVVIGEVDEKSGDLLAELYEEFDTPILRTDLRTAEMIKYASNAFLSAKVSFINEIGNICHRLGIDVYTVAKGMGYDERIGGKFLNAGLGFGGSCLPKDLKALIFRAREVGYQPELLQAVLNINQRQPLRAIELLKKHIPALKGETIGILGLAFKPETDEVTDSPAIPIVEGLLREGARVKAHDPMAMPNFARLFPQLEYVGAQEALESSAVIIVTDWPQFQDLDYRGRVVIDGRRVPKAREARIYERVC